jgi:hypothetical protein
MFKHSPFYIFQFQKLLAIIAITFVGFQGSSALFGDTILSDILNSQSVDRFAEAYSPYGFGGNIDNQLCTYSGILDNIDPQPPIIQSNFNPFTVTTFAQNSVKQQNLKDLGAINTPQTLDILSNPTVNQINLPFSLKKGGKNFNSYFVRSNNTTSTVDFGGSNPTPADNVSTSILTTSPQLYALTGGSAQTNGDFTLGAPIRYVTEGTAPNREHWAEFTYDLKQFAPIAQDEAQHYSLAGAPITIDPLRNDFDVNNHTIQNLAITTQPVNGSSTLPTASTIQYSPATGFRGQNTTSYSIQDTPGATSLPKNIPVTVTNLSATDEFVTLSGAGTASVPILTNDFTPNPVTISIVTLNNFGGGLSANLNGNNIDITSSASWALGTVPASVVYRITDTVTGETSDANLEVLAALGGSFTTTTYHKPVHSKSRFSNRLVTMKPGEIITINLMDAQKLVWPEWNPVNGATINDTVSFTFSNNSNSFSNQYYSAYINPNNTMTITALGGGDPNNNNAYLPIVANINHGIANRYTYDTQTSSPTINTQYQIPFNVDVRTVNTLKNITQFRFIETSNEINIYSYNQTTLGANGQSILGERVDTYSVTDSNGTQIEDGSVTTNDPSHGAQSHYGNFSSLVYNGYFTFGGFRLLPQNCLPTGVNDVVTPQANTPTNVNVLANDIDYEFIRDPLASPLTLISSTTGANGTTATIQGNQLVITSPAQAVANGDSITYTFEDSGGVQRTATLNIQSSNANQNPNAVNDLANVNVGGNATVNVLLNDTDPDPNTTLTICTPNGFTQGTQGTVTQIGNNLQYTPNSGASGTDTFTYTACDGNGGTDSATVTMTIIQPNPTNQPPVANDDTVSTYQGNAINIDVLANDTDPNPNTTLSFCSNIPPTNGQHGTVSINGNQLIYTPNDPAYIGSDTFTYTACDGNGGSDNATVTVNVQKINVTLDLYKDKPDSSIRKDDTVKIQGEIKNSTSILLPTVKTTLTLDANADLISNSGSQGAIQGQKYTFNPFAINVDAASGFTFSFVNNKTLEVSFSNLNPNETVQFVFDTKALSGNRSQIAGNARVLDAANRELTSAVDDVAYTPTTILNVPLPRTGGIRYALFGIYLFAMCGVIGIIGSLRYQKK